MGWEPCLAQVGIKEENHLRHSQNTEGRPLPKMDTPPLELRARISNVNSPKEPILEKYLVTNKERKPCQL